MKSAQSPQLDLFDRRPTPAPEQKPFTPGSQLARVYFILTSKPVIENRDFDLAGISYIARNKVSELRKMGYVVAQRGSGTGQDWLHNQYSLLAHPGDELNEMKAHAMREEGWHIYPEERGAKL